MRGYHFMAEDRRLGYGDGRHCRVGRTHKVKVEPVLCEAGLHASQRAIDALQYAPGPVCALVELGGEVVEDSDKAVATERTYLVIIDATDVLRAFARACALDVVDVWNCSDIVRRWLETGDEKIRQAARDAARAAASAAEDAAYAAAREAARAAWAARAAARDAQNTRLEAMLTEAGLHV